MNERIKELEVQCWDDIAPEWAENVHMVFNIEKFAELIIKDCASAVNSRDDSDTGFWANIIKEHFGVEE